MLKNHPKGLPVIFFTEMWERFGFYILMSVLVLFMDRDLGWSDSRKGDFYGWFLGIVYFIPIFGGWLGDKILGQINTIKLGAFIMIFGYISLAISSIDNISFFYAGLFLIAFGTGVFKVNMSVLVGNLYVDNLPLKDAGYNIYYMGVNLGAMIAPVVATILSNLFNSYRLSFWAAAIGLLIALVTLEFGKKKLYSSDNRRVENDKSKLVNQDISDREVKERIITLITMFAIVIFFWIAFYQNYFALTLFAQRSTIASDILKPETYQFFGPFFILALTPIVISIFNSLRKRNAEPSSAVKIFMGMIVMGISMLIMVVASIYGGNSDKNIMSPLWLISTYFVVTLSEILISPMGLSFVSKVAPAKVQGVMMGCWFGATAVGSYGSGILGKYYSDFSHHEYFLILTALLAFAAILVLVFLKRLKKFSA